MSEPSYKDPKKGMDERIQDLLERMTIEEKIAQLTSVWLELDPERALEFEALCDDHHVWSRCIGRVSGEGRFVLRLDEAPLLDLDAAAMRRAWQGTLPRLFPAGEEGAVPPEVVHE